MALEAEFGGEHVMITMLVWEITVLAVNRSVPPPNNQTHSTTLS